MLSRYARQNHIMKTGVTLVLAALSAIGGTGMIAGVHLPFVSRNYTPEKQCIEWYDGCNMCKRLQSGGVSCTDRACQDPGRGFCEQYAATSTPKA